MNEHIITESNTSWPAPASPGLPQKNAKKSSYSSGELGLFFSLATGLLQNQSQTMQEHTHAHTNGKLVDFQSKEELLEVVTHKSLHGEDTEFAVFPVW